VTEEWRPVVGYEGLYEVSDAGRVRSVDRYVERTGRPVRLRGVLMKLQRAQAGGYWTVAMCQGGLQRTHTVHSLVMQAFVGPRPDGMEVRHLDGDPTNSRLSNLAYGVPSENALDRVRHGTHNMTRKTHCKHGHEFTEANTYLMRSGGRDCRTCHNSRARAKRRELRAS